ncbi:hypothetical protein [Undibacterium umbellatum]|uniref:DUF4365 domain-containing protein n=1 Tax=Undibacterium umbellatum TaxID=2762300 RepID=A0ABR6ZI34_9BURK|nr:hypothetical protein [Undibacterium umbellatum]MBC3911020.1 hypothetical protein [Undibacterium umbellatum]
MISSSIRLLLEEFLGLMKEEGELDAFLPTVLVARNHEIVCRAQKGPRQYGVDIVSIEHTAFKPPVLCLWLVKCGNIGRSEWNGGSVQAIRPSVDEVETYIASSIRPEHRKLPIRLVIITNGDYLSSINQDMKVYLESWKNRNNADVETVNGSKLAGWVERGLLDENALSGSNKSLFRRTLANVATPELSLFSGRQLIDALLVDANGKDIASKSKLLKKQLLALRAIRTTLSVLQLWADDAKNLLAPYRLSEYAVLRVWATFHSEMVAGNEVLTKEYLEIFFQMLLSASRYHKKLLPYYITEDAFASQFSDNLFIADNVLSELGRLGLQGCIWAFLEVESKEEPSGMVQFYLNATLSLLKSHSISALPPYDHHASSIHAVLLFLLVVNKRDVAINWICEIIARLKHVSQSKEYWPSAATFEDTLLARRGLQVTTLEASRVTTLLPILLIWSAALKGGFKLEVQPCVIAIVSEP